VGLNDRGEIAPGQRADLVLVRIGEAGIPHVEAVFRDGAQVYSCRQPMAAGVGTW
jgi:alpha-D-ribose 1-methylphosphonate 5-triphosphate diphosphatase PhnM